MGSAVSSVFGGGGAGGILGAVGGIVGGIFGGPMGAMIGQAIGNMLQQAVGDSTKQAVDVLQQQHGLPKFLADEIKTKIDGALQQLHAHGVEPQAQAQAQHAVGDWMSNFIQGAAKQIVDEVTKQLKDEGKTGAASAESWLVTIAKAMGKTMGDRAGKLVDLSQRIANTSTGGDNNAQQAAAKQMQMLNAEFQATSQEFSLLQNTFSTAIKAIGEAMSSIARKQ